MEPRKLVPTNIKKLHITQSYDLNTSYFSHLISQILILNRTEKKEKYDNDTNKIIDMTNWSNARRNAWNNRGLIEMHTIIDSINQDNNQNKVHLVRQKNDYS